MNVLHTSRGESLSRDVVPLISVDETSMIVDHWTGKHVNLQSTTARASTMRTFLWNELRNDAITFQT